MKRIMTALFAVLLCVSMPLCAAAAENETENIFRIASLADWAAFAENCRLDAWSARKRVFLECDLDFTGRTLTSVPIFSGHFDGGGHVISGISLTGTGSEQGLFRQVAEGAVITRLTVSGEILPSGSKSTCGGIAGQNGGVLSFCSFSGTVAGDGRIGGIAGVNEKTGLIANCMVSGEIRGTHETGGIAGSNAGTVLLSSNRAAVGTVLVESGGAFSGLALDLDHLTSVTQSDLAGVMDIGGIAGLSSGLIQQCENYGHIGYPHVGYNVGGIAGRQSGRISDCANYADVYGRKDVGGIVGQMEPFTEWRLSDDLLMQLRQQLDTLDMLIDRAVQDADAAVSSAKPRLEEARGYVDSAVSALDSMAGQTVDFVDGNIGTLNEISARIAEITAEMEAVAGDAAESLDALERAMNAVRRVFVHLTEASEISGDGIDALLEAIDLLEAALDETKRAADLVQDGFEALRGALGDPEKMSAALRDIAAGMAALGEAFSGASSAFSDLEAASAALTGSESWQAFMESAALEPGSGETIAAFQALLGSEEFASFCQSAASASGALAIGLRQAGDSLGAAAEGVFSLMTSIKMDPDALKQAASDFEAAVRKTGQALYTFSLAGEALDEALVLLPGINYALTSAAKEAASAASSFRASVARLLDAAEGIEALLHEQGNRESIVFSDFGEDFRTAQQMLYSALQALSASVSDGTSAAAEDGGAVIRDLGAISDQLSVLFNLLLDGAERIGSAGSADDYKEDVSDTDQPRGAGEIADCRNRGDVQGDVNVGGVAGAVALEVSFDLEDELDISGFLFSNAKFQIYAAIRNSDSCGAVTAKKSCAGGIAGRMDYGLAVGSTGSGTVECEQGDYTGGVVGYATGFIKNCYARAGLSGQNYVGGIAGTGWNIENCVSYCQISRALEHTGAIAGTADGVLAGNLFIGNGISGVDGISYAGRAEMADGETLFSDPSLPEVFREVRITFLVEGDPIEDVVLLPGETLASLPAVPDRDGMYWVWNSLPYPLVYSMTLQGSYHAFRTTLATHEDPPHFLAEGCFGSNQTLTVEAWMPLSLPSDLENDGEAEAYRLTVEDYAEPLLVRMRASAGRIYCPSGSGWMEISAETDGSYLVFALENGSGFVYVPQSGAHTLVIVGGALAGALLLAAAVWLALRRKKKRAAKNRAALAAEQKSFDKPIQTEQKTPDQAGLK